MQVPKHSTLGNIFVRVSALSLPISRIVCRPKTMQTVFLLAENPTRCVGVASTCRYEYTDLAMAMGPQDFWMCLTSTPQHYTHQHFAAQQFHAHYLAVPVPKLKQRIIKLHYTLLSAQPRGSAAARLRGALGP
jgi:hypothetical protein